MGNTVNIAIKDDNNEDNSNNNSNKDNSKNTINNTTTTQSRIRLFCILFVVKINHSFYYIIFSRLEIKKLKNHLVLLISCKRTRAWVAFTTGSIVIPRGGIKWYERNRSGLSTMCRSCVNRSNIELTMAGG